MTKAIQTFREKWRHIIFGTDTPAGQKFDQILIGLILCSVLFVMLDSVPDYQKRFGEIFYFAEWAFTIIFTIEYLTRVFVSDTPKRYIFSFYGAVDILSILPTYLSLLFPGANYLLIIRLLRVLRVFRVLKLMEYMGEAKVLMTALEKARRKIIIFMFSVSILAIIYGSLMYLIEGPANGFTSIPKSIYWAVVTITTVGYGDISPVTALGQGLASLIMLTGYAIIAIPTGIVTAEIALLSREISKRAEKECSNCHKHSHSANAKFCDYCGTELDEVEDDVPEA